MAVHVSDRTVHQCVTALTCAGVTTRITPPMPQLPRWARSQIATMARRVTRVRKKLLSGGKKRATRSHRSFAPLLAYATAIEKVGIPLFDHDEYTLGTLLGEGSFSRVYQGKCRGEDVAIKLLRYNPGISDTRERRTFLKEVELLALLSHPNILSIMGACREDWGIITEYLPRGDLHRVLKSKIVLPTWRRIQFAIDIAEGMAWLSGQSTQILHRDLKPENVLVNQTWTCKIADFGLSSLTSLKEGKIRDKGKGPGSVLWMSPEVLLHQPLDRKLDVYSFGIVLWQICSRKRPYQDIDTYEELVEQVARKRHRPPIELVIPELKDIVKSAWAHTPELRPEFMEIIPLLTQSRIDHYFPISLFPNGNAFWKKCAPRGHTIALNTLYQELLKQLHRKITKDVPQEFLEEERLCLKELLSPVEIGALSVTIESLSKLLMWFGDLTFARPKKREHATQALNFLFAESTSIVDLMKKDWFYGEVGSSEATRTLEPFMSIPGAYLVRLNPGGNESIVRSPFTISRVNSSGSVTHIRVRRSHNGYGVRIIRDQAQSRIHSKHGILGLIRKIKAHNSHVCRRAVHVSPFRYIFLPKPEGNGYTDSSRLYLGMYEIASADREWSDDE